MNHDLECFLTPVPPEQIPIPKNRTFVRVRTNYFHTKDRFVFSKELRFMKKMSTGFNLVSDDLSCAGAELVFNKITNVDEVLDGIYEMVPCNQSRDFESGYIEDWDYVLVAV